MMEFGIMSLEILLGVAAVVTAFGYLAKNVELDHK